MCKKRRHEKENMLEDNDNTVDDKDGDSEYLAPRYSQKKSKTITIELPRNPWENPQTTQMMDRLKLTPNQSLGFFTSIVKTGTVDGKEVDLNEFTCSRSTVSRNRNKKRKKLLQLAIDEFQESKPKHCNIH